MQDFMNTSLWTILGIIVVVFLITLVLGAIALFFLIRRINRISEPDLAEMQNRLTELRRKNPNADNETLLKQMINQEAFKSAVIGAVTGLGGFITLPIALPVDVLLSLRIQSKLVQFIAMTYGQGAVSDTELKIQSYIVMSGGAKVSTVASEAVMKFILRILGKSFSKLIPVIGAVVSFGLNYAMAQATGNLALRWYANRHRLPGQQQPMLTAR